MAASTDFVGVPVFPFKKGFQEKLTDFFNEKYNALPQFYVRVPGRVNIIGEHIDYCGYSVLPMALEQDFFLAVRALSDSSFHISNLNTNYQDFVGDINVFCRGAGEHPSWYHYVLCGAAGVVSASKGLDLTLRGLQVAVTSNVPAAAGLSSSSALVCASALAVAHANKLKFSKMEMAKLCAKSEMLIGTEGGGMDQAIAFLAKKGSAQFISWNPLRASPVILPSDAVFVVAHSLVEANKAATDDYNQRVRDCKLAAKLLLKEASIEVQNDVTLCEAQEMIGEDLPGMLKMAHNLPSSIGKLKPRNRAIHVYSEALRVEQFREICISSDSSEDSKLARLGALMKASHDSLRDLYECSHPTLDHLVELSNEFGVQARLTGAGWGGCIVALCSRNNAESYVQMLKDKFYLENPRARGKDLSSLVFITRPYAGACVYENDL